MRTFYTIALILWIIGGSYFAKNYFCPTDKAKKPSATAAGAVGAASVDDECDTSLVFEDGDFTTSMSTNVLFPINSAQLKFVSKNKDEYVKVFSETAKYLVDNPERELLLEGIYFEFEEFETDEDNLGNSRALTLKQILIDDYKVNPDQLKTGGRSISDKKCYYNQKSKMVTKGIVSIFGEKL